MRTAAYARYSSENQSAASIDDQLRNVRAYCDRMGWPAPEVFSDAAVSGARSDRPGYRRLLDAAGRLDVILVDDLSRLSRDSIESAQTVKRLTFAGVRLIGVSDGVDTGRKSHKADVGLRGLMSELYLDDLADKTHRGLSGKALAGQSAGGLPYGYRVAGVGAREIDPDQAEVVRRIYRAYLEGDTARAIAAALNREGVPSPRGGTWAASAIFGDRRRGIGILANPIYAGRQVWNRSHWIKHPDTGRRVRQERPESEWIVTEHPELVIVPAATWEAAQARMGRNSVPTGKGGPGRPARHLLSGLLKCAQCGGPMVVVDRYSYACSVAKERGTCASRVRLRRKDAEHALLAGVREQLLSDEAFKRFQRAAAAALKKRAPGTGSAERALVEAQRVHGNVMNAIRAGIITPSTKAELVAAEAAVANARAALEAARAYQPAKILPHARKVWARITDDLAGYSRNIPKAREALRELLGPSITVATNENGDLVAEIAAASDAQINMVAGAGSVLYLPEPVRIVLTRDSAK